MLKKAILLEWLFYLELEKIIYKQGLFERGKTSHNNF